MGRRLTCCEGSSSEWPGPNPVGGSVFAVTIEKTKKPIAAPATMNIVPKSLTRAFKTDRERAVVRSRFRSLRLCRLDCVPTFVVPQ